MSIEEPKYIIISKNNDYEIRQYGTILIAETKIESNFEDVGKKAFRILADYIFGNNKSKTKIAMTVPVTQQLSSEKISMTAPVTQIPTLGGFLVQFTMPSNFTLETIPTPNDSRVTIKQITARKIAVYRYSGSWSQARYKIKLEQFREKLKKDHINIIGEPVFARFNSPFQFWFLRRNEIWIEVAV